jgi:hypothetical protein
MAKSQRSNRKKALRTHRAERAAPWQEAADAARAEAMQRCLDAPPLPVQTSAPPPVSNEAALEARGRAGAGTSSMAVDGASEQQQQSGSRKKGGLHRKGGLKKKKTAAAVTGAVFKKRSKKKRR